MSNKPFDLEKALAGEPFNLDGEKRYAAKQVDGLLIHYSIDKDGKLDCSWNSVDYLEDESGATMWQEPRPRVQLGLPCPLKEVKNGTTVYYISINTDPLGLAYSEIVVDQTVFDEENHYHKTYLDGGFYFTTKEDAQEWLDAMRNAHR